MRRNQLRFLSMPAESSAARLSSLAKFSGVTIPRMKPPGNDRKIYGKTTHTDFLANPNLEGEIHLKGVGLYIPNFQFGMLYIRSSLHSIFYCILTNPQKNPKQLKDPRRELGIFVVFIFDFYQIMKRGFWF